MHQELIRPLSLKRWVWMSFAGWFIGIALVVAFAILGEALGAKNDSGGQALVGIGMSMGMGLMQWIALRKHIRAAHYWFIFSMIGFTFSYVCADVLGYLFKWDIQPEFVLPVATAFGALISATFQYAFILKKFNSKSRGWIIVNTLAWLLAHLMITGLLLLNFKLPEMPRWVSACLAIVFLLSGGPLLGVITGRFIVPALNRGND